MRVNPQWLLLVSLVVVGALSAFAGSFNPYYIDIAVMCGVNVTLAVSLNLINGYTGQFSLGHAGFMAVGAYTAAVLTSTSTSALPSLLGDAVWLAFPIALLAGGFAAGMAGLIVGAPSLRLRGDYLAIVTLGFGEIIRVVLNNIESVGGPRGMIGIPAYANLAWAWGLAAVCVYFVLAMLHSTYGRGFIAVADDEVAAEAMGINTMRYKLTAFLVGAFFAGLAGGVYAHFKNYIVPSGFGFDRSIEIVVMVILGGMGNTAGVIFAAILLTLLPEWLREFGDLLYGWAVALGMERENAEQLKRLGDYRMIFYSLLIVLLMILRPQGLFRLPLRTKRAGT